MYLAKVYVNIRLQLYTVCHSPWFLSQASLFQFHVSAFFEFLVLDYVAFFITNAHFLNLLPDSQRTTLQLNSIFQHHYYLLSAEQCFCPTFYPYSAQNSILCFIKIQSRTVFIQPLSRKLYFYLATVYLQPYII